MSLNGHIPLSRTNTATNAEKELRGQMPPLQTKSLDRNNTTQPRPLTAARTSTSEIMSNDGSLKSPTSPTRHKRFVLTDIVASRYLEDDPHTTVLARRQTIEGYEIYLVEQWACSRTHPTFLITTYTGNPQDTVLATIISVPADEARWSPAMQLYFNSLNEYHAKRRDTPYGTLMITNLNGFPSSLTVIPIPGGDVRKYKEIFYVNENLKRLGCSGRLGIKLASPSGATEAKFHQLYRTSEKIPLNGAVIELVKLCQVALVLFGKLEPEYADGLLCDVTEKAINDWWVEFGAEYYAVEPHDGILGPTTVAALLGMLMGARNRLSALNAPVAKDVFDIESTKKGIAHFQKSHHIPRSKRLDRQTLDKLRRATAKAATKEGWGVPRAFKSTVAELGGKGGEMVMGIVGAGEKDGIAEVETVDIDRFVELVRGDHAKWLWYGRARKTGSGDMFDRLPDEDGQTSPVVLQDRSRNSLKRQSTLEETKLPRQEVTRDDHKKEVFSPDGTEPKDRDPFSKRAAIKARLDPERGFHRIKDAVGLRSHASKSSRDEQTRLQLQGLRTGLNAQQPDLDGVYDDGNELSGVMSAQRIATDLEPSFAKVLTETPHDSATNLVLNKAASTLNGDLESLGSKLAVAESEASTQPPTAEPSVAGSIYHGIALNEVLPLEEVHAFPPLLRRTQSADQLELYGTQHSDEWWPRHLSFSITEESVLTWEGVVSADVDEDAIDDTDTSAVALVRQQVTYSLQSEQLKRLHHRLAVLSVTDSSWVKFRLDEIKDLDAAADGDIGTLESIYYPRLDTYHSLRENTHAVITNNRAQLTASLRELDNVNDKLEYEITALRGKVEDVEDFVDEFEKQVEYVCDRVEELETTLGGREGWWHWIFRKATGLGSRPA
ncbi:Sin3 complex subunit [Didymella exigua CBS 183.55]|uniref:Sin3 complex subunit n=1 Tax=Didymella exigua CBS 183.55 TaxID=1150837 RepID=A0A6A5RB47_9PLEO|nr:Sin3 complex subunit [Didymella exigua CBS 183.55]KAF1924753.1 Sin3 complex subunit [Didymella exigua CBS 183.55]